MGVIATEGQAQAITNCSGISFVSNRCCTKSKAEELYCVVSGSYASNQLVQLSDLSAPQITPLGSPLYITIYGPGAINFSKGPLEYSYDKSSWHSFPSYGLNIGGAGGSGTTIYFRGDMYPSNWSWPNYGIGRFTIAGSAVIGGNVNSLVGYRSNLSSYSYYFYRLFYKCSTIGGCSSDLFDGIEVLGPRCFEEMFLGCYNLPSGPNIPNTTMKDYCCRRMFLGCSALTSIVSMPSTLLAPGCYQEMYRGCSITNVGQNALPATTLYHHCYMQMFMGCTGLITAPRLPATSLAWGCYAGMFEGCSSLTTAPDLKASLLVQDCYDRMFYGCNSLTYLKCLTTNIDSTRYGDSWWDSDRDMQKQYCLNKWTGESNGYDTYGSGGYLPYQGTFIVHVNNSYFDPRNIYDEEEPWGDDNSNYNYYHAWTVNVSYS